MDEDTPINNLPWFRGSKDIEPFTLVNVVCSDDPNSPPFHATSTFPWALESIFGIDDGSLAEQPARHLEWRNMITEWTGAVVVGSNGRIFIFRKYGCAGSPQSFTIRDDLGKETDWKVVSLAWSFSDRGPLRPLVVFAASSIIFVLDPSTRELVGCIRGHGGEITSVTTNPRRPYIFCTTSRDMTSRLYDVNEECRQSPKNPHWPPRNSQSLAGPAFGLQLTGSEGNGFGCSIAVFVGGRSGGHQAAVLGAAFNPFSPLVATCGMDRHIKIWHISSSAGPNNFYREDKPLFTSDLVHKSRVLSITWLSQDTLISHSAPALMRRDPHNREDLYEEEGTVVVWRWLGYDRFFPPGMTPMKHFRGVASDFRGSESFKILAAYSLPMITTNVRVYQSPTHDPILLVPMGRIIRIFNISQFEHRDPPPFPYDEKDFINSTKKMKLADTTNNQEPSTTTENVEDMEPEEDPTPIYPPPIPPRALFQDRGSWEIGTEKARSRIDTLADVEHCEVTCGGSVIIGVGKKGTLFVWKRLPAT